MRITVQLWANGSCPRGGMRQNLFDELLNNKEWCWCFSFFYIKKENGEKGSDLKKNLKLEKGFGEDDLLENNLRVIWL